MQPHRRGGLHYRFQWKRRSHGYKNLPSVAWRLFTLLQSDFSCKESPPIISRMVQWTLHSNACDVLSLGPRAAGRLATVGVRTVAELLATKPQAAADGQFSAETVAAWQREAKLLVALPQLPSDAARVLAAIGVGSAEQLLHSTPTQLIAEIESLWRSENAHTWKKVLEKPTVRAVCAWIGIAQQASSSRAA